MIYSLNKLTSPADCDVLIEVAGKEKDDLQYIKQQLLTKIQTLPTLQPKLKQI